MFTQCSLNALTKFVAGDKKKYFNNIILIPVIISNFKVSQDWTQCGIPLTTTNTIRFRIKGHEPVIMVITHSLFDPFKPAGIYASHRFQGADVRKVCITWNFIEKFFFMHTTFQMHPKAPH